MPFVRFSRDRRGYEHVYLIEPVKERGRSRVLYWFRTPPGVKVGRNPFDAATQRVLEQQNPDVHFDWAQIVAAKPPPVAPVESWREKRRVERAIKKARASETIETETPEGRVLDDDETPPLVELQETNPPDIGDVVPLDTAALLDPDPVSGDEAPHHEFVTRSSDGSGDNVPGPPTDNVTGPVPGGLPEGERRRKRRRRRRGRRRPGEPVQPASTAPGNGSLDPPVADDETSNDG